MLHTWISLCFTLIPLILFVRKVLNGSLLFRTLCPH